LRSNSTKAEAAAKEITKLATNIGKSSAPKTQKVTEANVKKFDDAITIIATPPDGANIGYGFVGQANSEVDCNLHWPKLPGKIKIAP